MAKKAIKKAAPAKTGGAKKSAAKSAKKAPAGKAGVKSSVKAKPAAKSAVKKDTPAAKKASVVRAGAKKSGAKTAPAKAPVAKKAVAKKAVKPVTKTKAPAKAAPVTKKAPKPVAKKPAAKPVKAVKPAPAKPAPKAAPAKPVAKPAPTAKPAPQPKKAATNAPVKTNVPVVKSVVKPNVGMSVKNNKPEAAKGNDDQRSRYSDAELVEFKELINKKLDEATRDYELLKNTLSHKDDHGTDDTSPTFKLLEDGSDVLSKEETAHLAARQEKYIQNLKNALIRIQNKTYGICRVTGKLIPKERLRSVPHATLSIDAKLGQNR
jgi:RNA polymerase-binding transcription factor DksA